MSHNSRFQVGPEVVLRQNARVLFLDDMHDRHVGFAARTDGVTVDHVYTAAEAIRLLGSVQYDAVFLDHDLSDEHYGADPGVSDPTTGLAVARWMEEREWTYERPTVVVHSMNPVGARRMLGCFHPSCWSSFHVSFDLLLPRLRVWKPSKQED